MEVFKRIRRMTAARIEQCISLLETPERIVPQLVIEMEDQHRNATQAETQALAEQKLVESEIAQIKKRIEHLGQGATVAIARHDEATAREALAAQIEAEHRLVEAQAAMVRAQQRFESAQKMRHECQAQLIELRHKKRQIVSRARSARAHDRVNESTRAGATSILGTLARMESQVDEAEAEVEARVELHDAENNEIEQRLKTMELDAEVESRIAALRASAGSR